MERNENRAKTRNPEAVCGNCPYYYTEADWNRHGYCYRFPHHIGEESKISGAAFACGEHPNFFTEAPND